MTKLSYKIGDFASSVVLLKDGSCLEVRRGALTGKAIPDRRTWASEAEWRATLPASAVDATSRLHQLLLAHDFLTAYNVYGTDNTLPSLNELLDYVMTAEGRDVLDHNAYAMRSVQKYAYEINYDAKATTAIRRKALLFLRTTDFNINLLYDRCCGRCDRCKRKANILRPLTQEEEDTINAHLRQEAGSSNVQMTYLMDAEHAVSPADLPSNLTKLTPEQVIICKKLTASLEQFKQMPRFRVIYSFPAVPKLEVEEVKAAVKTEEKMPAPVKVGRMSESEVAEIKAEVVETPAEFSDTVQRLLEYLSGAPASCNALSDLLMAAPESLRDHIRRNHYLLTCLRAGMHHHAGLPSAEAVLTAYTPLF